MLKEEIEKFENFDLDAVVHSNRDINFNEQRQPLDEIYGMFKEMIAIVKVKPLNQGIEEPFNIFLYNFNNLLNQLQAYDFNSDVDRNFYKNLKLSVTNVYRQYFRLNQSDAVDPGLKNSDFLLVYNYIKQRSLDSFATIQTEAKGKLKEIEDAAIQQVNSSEEKFNNFKAEAETTLSLLNKEVGKIGVKTYANIFDNQASEHSRFLKNGFGKAQLWIAFAALAFALLIFSFSKMDSFFSVKDQYIFTPEVVVHIIGRFLVISLFIFIVSFSFKQYRVNMHLYTLNRHRANTLKSFEYLTTAPDKLAPESYNAILMEVAKSIYEAGQTGYIGVSENQGDIPSIIDMTKIITQPKN